MVKRGWVRAGLLLCVGLGGVSYYLGAAQTARTPQPGTAGAQSELAASTPGNQNGGASEQPWDDAIATAATANELAQNAISAADWDQVVRTWTEAVQALQSVPPDSPQRIFVQRRLQAYLTQLEQAQQQAQRASAQRQLPPLGSPILDEQVALYRSYVATMGPPEVLIVGSSRALQGVDPQVLQQGLSGAGDVQAYTFAVNGATAQMVSFVLRQLLTPDELPQMVLWPGGSRSLNSARFDRTFAALLASPGYAAVRSGQTKTAAGSQPSQLPISDINAYGFLPISEQFAPATYYRQFPRVSGRYDGDYRPFSLDGVQTQSFQAVADFLRSQQIPLVFVNLPLSSDYLDPVRLGYERQFQQFLQRQSQRGGFRVVDLLEQWQGQNQYFADPSHLNRFGAAAIARQLAASRSLPWPQPAESAR